MTYSFSNDFYYNALLDANLSGLEHIYAEFRQPSIRAVAHAGGTYADAAVFFMTALQEIAALFRQKEIQKEEENNTEISDAFVYAAADKPPFFQQLETLALAHYKDWLLERGQQPMGDVTDEAAEKETAQEEIEITDAKPQNNSDNKNVGDNPAETVSETVASLPEEDENSISTILPEPEKLRLTRSKIYAWKKMALLPEKTITTLQNAIQGDKLSENTGVKALSDAFKLNIDFGTNLPAWVIEALTDKHGYTLWKHTQNLERRISAGLPIIAAPRRIHRTEYVARFIFMILLTGCIAWIFWPRGSKAAKQAYKDVFAPPESIMADLEQRYGPDLAFDSLTTRSPSCMAVLQQADKDYQKKNYLDALSQIGDLYENGDPLCQSDALFYMGIIFLQLEEPGKTIACFAKIEDLERYGEDIYWYQALAFVKKAEADPDNVKIARKAVKQAIANTQNPERREQAEKILLKLGTTQE